MATTPVTPRELAASEREVLLYLLAADFPGAAGLRAQVPYARVVGVWVEGLPSVDIEVPAGVAAAPVADGEVIGADVEDGEYIGGLGIWVTGGYLSAIEYYWVTDEPPSRLPEISQLTVCP